MTGITTWKKKASRSKQMFSF